MSAGRGDDLYIDGDDLDVDHQDRDDHDAEANVRAAEVARASEFAEAVFASAEEVLFVGEAVVV